VALLPRGCFPGDRAFALLRAENTAEFDQTQSAFLHKTKCRAGLGALLCSL
jgi:hypothetical protein